MSDGGFSAALRGSARLSLMMLNNSSFNRQQIVPSAWIDDIRNHGDNVAWSRHHDTPTAYPDGHYRAFWYKAEDDRRSFFGVGVFGQHYWIDPRAQAVIVKNSSHSVPADAQLTLINLKARSVI